MIIKTHYGTFNSSISGDLLESRFIRRLAKIFQDDLSPAFYMRASKATRLEHTIGVVHLTTLVNASKEEKKLLEYSALLHDIGLPCFGHIGESVMQRVLGKGHEENALDIIKNSEIRITLKKEGVLEQVIKIFNKKHYLAKLIFGDIDLDNTDNLYIYQIKKNKKPKHNPIKLASSFYINNKKIFFSSDIINEIRKWKRTRYDVYNSLLKKERLVKSAILEEALFYFCLKDRSILALDNNAAVKQMLRYPPSKELLECLIKNKPLKPKYFEISENDKEPRIEKDWSILNKSVIKLDKDITINTNKGLIKLNKIYRDKIVHIAF
ncbi:HD domain-containing protein [Candidatus Woesearchaeota archaeon]|nr:HD domain-containing protein [Candidatus Woesearchaeota archaeon]